MGLIKECTMMSWASLLLALINRNQETQSYQWDRGTKDERFCKESRGQGGCDGKEKLKERWRVG